MAYRPTIGLEVHAELKTNTKMFCSSRNDPDETRPNTNVCPVCLAHPGTLPVVNHEAVWHVLRIGTAVGGRLADFSEFDRKSYFYPDIPKGYQISQYEHPLVSGGELAGVALTRIHLEEDTASSIHDVEGTRVDFNRAGIPLMELVTEPVIHDSGTAGRFARELQLLLRTLEAGDANLEKGEMRLEANISVSAREGELGTKVEVKNINSFRSVERAIDHEIQRQIELIENGKSVTQETRGWDEGRQATFHQRFKEGSADYRYFPEPDLPKLRISDIETFSEKKLLASLPELPWERRARYQVSYALKESDANYLITTTDRINFFDAVARALGEDAELTALAANYIVSDLGGIFAKKGTEDIANLPPAHFAKLIRLVASGTLSSRGAKDTLAVLVENGGDPEKIAQERGLIQIQDTGTLQKVISDVIREEEKAVAEYRGGKEAAMQYLIGKAMQKSHGAGNPGMIREMLAEALT
ncbi:Asp-tRNA(Asn)/Glu-tRNA(Gln) amidotransferase subunit GatB [Candidatus Kaiserbacteria bacterium CG10_big_fil_rev_8_21_14_0_10_56_12]|uniref:Aspartyl/glutamyl-tRNA(Asn/Gln) amidotransferase subunit B n=1 Tax=Candidatus Kaiserbacteria bacterium CG10_big_fil_rev_8_21_14_0_10_56_12 TaxID=1974611 RepID=A0A2H0U9N8_9BACT|nr:MAG: Asp-tRNA(Asn)/Glu-tRNA(Gln) amidotransferase subunit GatB [Candidatus Kaiserbacteria bacterium CG10_big_fil_rev_8_21_14_0_10_56_12]